MIFFICGITCLVHLGLSPGENYLLYTDYGNRLSISKWGFFPVNESRVSTLSRMSLFIVRVYQNSRARVVWCHTVSTTQRYLDKLYLFMGQYPTALQKAKTQLPFCVPWLTVYLSKGQLYSNTYVCIHSHSRYVTYQIWHIHVTFL